MTLKADSASIKKQRPNISFSKVQMRLIKQAQEDRVAPWEFGGT